MISTNSRRKNHLACTLPGTGATGQLSSTLPILMLSPRMATGAVLGYPTSASWRTVMSIPVGGCLSPWETSSKRTLLRSGVIQSYGTSARNISLSKENVEIVTSARERPTFAVEVPPVLRMQSMMIHSSQIPSAHILPPRMDDIHKKGRQ